MDGNFVWLLVPTRLISDFRLVATYVRLEESRWDICSMMNRPIGIQPFSEKAICGFKMLITLHPMGLKFCLSCVMWTFSTIFVLCMGTLSRLLLPENFDIKFFEFLPKMTGRGGLGAISYFSWTRGGTRGSHAKFQVSSSIPSYR